MLRSRNLNEDSPDAIRIVESSKTDSSSTSEPQRNKNAKVRINIVPTRTGDRSSTLDDDVFSNSDTSPSDGSSRYLEQCRRYLGYLKRFILVIIWLICCIVLMTKTVKVREDHQLSITKNFTKEYIITEAPEHDAVLLRLQGAFLPEYYSNLSKNSMQIWVQMLTATGPPVNRSSMGKSTITSMKNVSDIWMVPLVSDELLGIVPEIVQEKLFHLDKFPCPSRQHCYVRVKLRTNLQRNFPVSVACNMNPINTYVGIIYAALVLIFLYILIIFDLVHKTLAAMIASTISVGVLAALDARPTMTEIISWIDIETLLLLFSMMTLVAIVGETGIFDYLAVQAFKVTGGRIWPLVNTLCLISALLSCVLDNVTTALLMTPITIRLCEVMKLNPVPVLINMMIYSNIGGAITPIGDPPNVMVASNAAVIKSGVNFGVFTLHMSVGVIISLVIVHMQLRFVYRNASDFRYSEPNDVQELRREIEACKRTAASMGSYSKEENLVKDSLMKRTSKLQGRLNTRTSCKSSSPNDYSINLQDLQTQYPIRDKILLIKSSITMCFVITVFFLHSLPELGHLGLGWTALLGALLLLILSGRDDLDAIFAKVEWGTLLFFASLFILMEALSRLGLIDWIGNQTQTIIMGVEQDARLAVSILIILWVSACASAFVDNIPLTTMMIKIATGLAENRELGLPLQPLVWALSFGACLGGNGTLFGSSSNIVCAGVAEQHGYKFSFLGFMKIGLPIMITSMCVVTVYLLIVHTVFCWH